MSQCRYFLTSFLHRDFSRFFTAAASVRTDESGSALIITGDKLTDGWASSIGILLKLNIGNDDVVFEYRSTAGADRIPAGRIPVYVRSPAVLTGFARHFIRISKLKSNQNGCLLYCGWWICTYKRISRQNLVIAHFLTSTCSFTD